MDWDKTYKEAKRVLLTLENQLEELESVCSSAAVAEH